MTIKLITVTWSYEDTFDIENTYLWKSFKKFNPDKEIVHFHFNRSHYQHLESEFNNRFGIQSEYILYKIQLLSEKVREVNTDYVIFCDANDVTCIDNVDRLISTFDLTNTVIFGAEKNQWPTPDRKKDWVGYTDYTGFDIKNEFYLNSGMILSTKNNYITLLSNIISNILSNDMKLFHNDQGVFTWHYNMNGFPTIKLDYGNVFTVNTFKRSTSEYELKNGSFHSKFNSVRPCFVHDNGWEHGSPKFTLAFELKQLYS